jgi:hypothetical protein
MQISPTRKQRFFPVPQPVPDTVFNFSGFRFLNQKRRILSRPAKRLCQ